jgi:hypothetical protein
MPHERRAAVQGGTELANEYATVDECGITDGGVVVVMMRTEAPKESKQSARVRALCFTPDSTCVHHRFLFFLVLLLFLPLGLLPLVLLRPPPALFPPPSFALEPWRRIYLFLRHHLLCVLCTTCAVACCWLWPHMQ